MDGLLISFQGLDADHHLLEAFSGIESAAGIARALTLIGHYAATGTVRHRFPFDENVKIYLEAAEPGSFNLRVKFVVGTVVLGLTTNGIYDLSKSVFAKAVGKEATDISQEVQNLCKEKSGDIDALVEAVEPALLKAHYGIGGTANEVVITHLGTGKVLARFDQNTKRYLKENIDGDDDIQNVTISALNVNNRTGRAYFHDLGRTVPFKVSLDANRKTIRILSDGLNNYAHNNPAPTKIHFTRIEAYDGRLKRIIIHKAEDVSAEN